MLKGVSKILAAAVAVLAIPAASQAATVVLTYDAVTVFSGPNLTGTSTNFGTVSAVTVPAGGSIRYNVRATVTNNANTASPAYTDLAQPAQLGIGGFGARVTQPTPVLTPRIGSGTTSTVQINTLFASVSNAGTVDAAAGGIGTGLPATFIAGGTNSGAVDASIVTNRFTIGTSTTPTETCCSAVSASTTTAPRRRW